MQLFVWNDVKNATKSWHHEGGIVVIAPDLVAARAMIKEAAPACEALEVMPDIVRDCAGPPLIAIHPNAGCC